MKVAGREPAVFVAVVEAVLALLVTFQLDGLSSDQATLILAVVVAIGGAVTAYATRDTFLAALVGVGKAAIVLGVGYGLPLTDEQVGLTVAVLSTLVGVFGVRPQTSPVETAISSA
jgi:hypothetical protein